jgi:hypothetical protein
MVYGMFFRFYKLIKNAQERRDQLHLFYKRLITRGYSPTFLRPIFRNTTASNSAHTSQKRMPSF